MKLLVITPTLGKSPWLDATVASVAVLPIAHEHVLVAPTAVVTELMGRFPEIKVVPEVGGGLYAAINTGLAAAQGWDAFTYLNDDDLLLPGFARSVAALAGQAGRPCLIYGGVRLIDRASRRIGAIPVSPHPGLNRALYAQRIEPVYQHGMLVSRAAWAEQGGFDESFLLCGDSEYLARLCVRGVPAVRVWTEVAAFRLHPDQLTKGRAAMDAERTRVDAKLGLLDARCTWRHHWARAVFRAANLPAYVGRVWRHGPVPFDQLLERGG
jgi:GT2 family glycosyltransferase